MIAFFMMGVQARAALGTLSVRVKAELEQSPLHTLRFAYSAPPCMHSAKLVFQSVITTPNTCCSLAFANTE